MVKWASLFSQLLSLIDRHQFESAVKEVHAEKAAKGFSCWEQLVAMLFCQLAQARSIREIGGGLRSCEGKLCHLGISQAPKRSTLSYANAHRPWELFERVFYSLLERVQAAAPRKKLRFKNKLLSLDATVIELCVSMFDWARFRTTKGALKLHLLLDHDGFLPVYACVGEGREHELKVAWQLQLPKGAVVVMDRGYVDYRLFKKWTEQEVFFVTRQKRNCADMVLERHEVPVHGPVLADETVVHQPFEAGAKARQKLRRVVIWLEDKKQELVLITNNFTLGASTIAAIYKQRWQIELFFKALKQQLRIKTFVGTSTNAVRIQIWTALIAMLLVKQLQFCSQLKWALSNLVALLRWNLFSYRDLWQWINAPFETPPEMPGWQQMDLDLDSSRTRPC
jgi:Transposase DDE domain/Domain of unknown function (DUF4372)